MLQNRGVNDLNGMEKPVNSWKTLKPQMRCVGICYAQGYPRVFHNLSTGLSTGFL